MTPNLKIRPIDAEVTKVLLTPFTGHVEQVSSLQGDHKYANVDSKMPLTSLRPKGSTLFKLRLFINRVFVFSPNR